MRNLNQEELELKKKVKESLDLTFQLEQITVSKELRLKTMEAINQCESQKEVQSSQKHLECITKEIYHRIPKDKKSHRRRWFRSIASLAAACLVLLLGSFVSKGIEKNLVNQIAGEEVADEQDGAVSYDLENYSGQGNKGLAGAGPLEKGNMETETAAPPYDIQEDTLLPDRKRYDTVIELNGMDDKELVQLMKLEELFITLLDQPIEEPKTLVWDYYITLYTNENLVSYYKISKDAYISTETVDINIDGSTINYYSFNEDFEEILKQIQLVLEDGKYDN